MKKYEDYFENKIKLPDHLIKKGMGFQVVNVLLKNGSFLEDRKVLNSEYLLIDKSEDIKTSDIIKIFL